MTHEYTLVVGGTVLPGDDQREAGAIAWAEGTILALGSDAAVRAISRGDSHVVDLHGAFVIPLEADGAARWPTDATLAVGGPADLAVLRDDPRSTQPGPEADRATETLATVRAGHLVAGAWPAAAVRGARAASRRGAPPA